MKKIIRLTLALLMLLSATNIFSYSVTDPNKIIADPGFYKGKDVIIYTKFDTKTETGKFRPYTSIGIEYVYDVNDNSLTDIINSLRTSDKVTIKGRVLDRQDTFYPVVEVHAIAKSWIDMTIMLETKDQKKGEVEVTCPNCGHHFWWKTE
ncbi:MAG: hypothetical protein ABH857_02030 [Elusimicrobiota bacterium]